MNNLAICSFDKLTNRQESTEFNTKLAFLKKEKKIFVSTGYLTCPENYNMY
jgi:hypothetical protein